MCLRRMSAHIGYRALYATQYGDSQLAALDNKLVNEGGTVGPGTWSYCYVKPFHTSPIGYIFKITCDRKLLWYFDKELHLQSITTTAIWPITESVANMAELGVSPPESLMKYEAPLFVGIEPSSTGIKSTAEGLSKLDDMINSMLPPR